MNGEVERRKAFRVAVAVPVRTTNAALGNVVGVTRDLSLSGAYFYIESDSWKEGGSIEYFVHLPRELTLTEPTLAFVSGKVVRVEQLIGTVGIAVQHESFSWVHKP